MPRQSAGATIQSSSVVERSAVNRLVVGSNPTSGAIFKRRQTVRLLTTIEMNFLRRPSLFVTALILGCPLALQAETLPEHRPV